MQVSIPAGGEDTARAFYANTLGLTEVPKPAALQARGGAWFRSPDTDPGVELHVGVEAAFVPARKAHPAIEVADVDAVAARVSAAGYDLTWDDAIPGTRRFHTADGHGNRIEIQAPAQTAPEPAGRKPRLTLTSVTIGSDDPLRLARFYADLFGTEIAAHDPVEEDGSGGWAQLRAPGGPTLNLEYERHFTAPVWPARPGSPTATQHLDIWVDDLEAATSWALRCGALLAPEQPQDEVRVLLDPSGHPFCLFL